MRHARDFLVDVGETAGVDVAEADEVRLGVGGAFGDIGEALAIDADRDDLDLRVQVTCPDNRGKGEGRERRGAQEVSTGEGHGWGGVSSLRNPAGPEAICGYDIYLLFISRFPPLLRFL